MPTGTPGPDNLSNSSGDNNVFGLAGDDVITINVIVAGSPVFITVDGGDDIDTLNITAGQIAGLGEGATFRERLTYREGANFSGTVDWTNIERVNVRALWSGSLRLHTGVSSDDTFILTGSVQGSGPVNLWLYGGNDTVVLTGAHAGAEIRLGDGDNLVDFTGVVPSANTVYHVYGGSGLDRMLGGSGEEALFGFGGSDYLSGGAGDDFLDGGEGDDTLVAGLGADELYGSVGNDTYVISDSRALIIEYASEGADKVESSVSFVLSGWYIEALVLTGDAAISGTGNQLDNVIIGNDAGNVLHGGSGADYLVGGLGNDRLIGDGNDDQLYGGPGNDTYVVNDPAAYIVEFANEGSDAVESSVSYLLSGWYIEALTLTGLGAINGTGNQLDNVLLGNDAANVLHGGSGVDYLAGAGGNDTLVGFGGDDQLYGGLGNDTYVVDTAGTFIVEYFGEGTDTVESSSSYALSGWEIENLTLTGLASIDGTGNQLGNVITGNDFANTLDGGLGADVLTGGFGADRFAFTSDLGNGNVDHIADFLHGADRILLSGGAGQPFAALAEGALAEGSFVTGIAAADADDFIIYDSASGQIFYDADGSGAGSAVLFATVQPGVALSAADFIVI